MDNMKNQNIFEIKPQKKRLRKYSVKDVPVSTISYRIPKRNKT